MDLDNIIPYVVFATLIGYLFYSYWTDEETVVKRKLRRLPRRSIGDFRNGEVGKITGLVEGIDEPMSAPLSGRPCHYYRVVVQQKRSSGKSSTWHTMIDVDEQKDFMIKEGDQIAILEPKVLRMYVVEDGNFSSGFLNDATPELESFLQEHGVESEGLFGFNKTLRYREGILQHGETVAACGLGSWQIKRELNTRNRVLVLTDLPDDAPYLSDDVDVTDIN